MDLLFSASIVASFLAGIAALFAPCCITVLLPTYLASVFQQKSTVFFMTFIYFLGLVSVFLPLGLGATFLTKVFSDYHDQVFIVGGTILTILGLLLASGKSFSLPVNIHLKLQKTDSLSVFGLGIFSGIATTCCAPVLAGVLALSALPGSYLLGTIFTLAYVLGLVAPLFILAAVMDRSGATAKLMALRKPVFGQVTLSNLISGIMFLGLGLIILNKARAGQLTIHTSYQLSVNLAVAGLTEKIGRYTRVLPEPVWAVLILLAVIVIIISAVCQWKKNE